MPSVELSKVISPSQPAAFILRMDAERSFPPGVNGSYKARLYLFFARVALAPPPKPWPSGSSGTKTQKFLGLSAAGTGSRHAAALPANLAMEKNEAATHLNFWSAKISGKKVVLT